MHRHTQSPHPSAASASSLEATMRRDVRELATSAGRMVGTDGHRAARAILVERLQGLKLEPYPSREGPASFCLPYGPQTGAGPGVLAGACNVMAVVPGRDRSLAPVLLAAHYDTCGALPGADDNAAAIAIALEVAAQLRARPADRDLIVALFDGEEYPRFLSTEMGSIHWYHHQRRGPVHAALVLDLVGHDVAVPGREDLLFVMGMESHPALVFPDLADARGLHVQPVLNRYVGDLSDHHVFRIHGDPFLFLSCGRWEHYHAASDTPEKLNYAKMAAIAELTQGWVRRIAGLSLAGPADGEGRDPSLSAELGGIRRNFGPYLGDLVDQLNTRAHVDAFVAMAMKDFGL